MDFLNTIYVSILKYFNDFNNFLNQLKGFRWSYQNWKWKTEKETCWKRKNVEWTTTRAQARKSVEVWNSTIRKVPIELFCIAIFQIGCRKQLERWTESQSSLSAADWVCSKPPRRDESFISVKWGKRKLPATKAKHRSSFASKFLPLNKLKTSVSFLFQKFTVTIRPNERSFIERGRSKGPKVNGPRKTLFERRWSK